MHNYEMLSDIYTYLQRKSPRYPWVTFYVARKEFYEKVVMQKGYSMDKRTFDTAINQSNYDQNQ